MVAVLTLIVVPHSRGRGKKRAAHRGPSLHTSKRQLSAIRLRLGHAIARGILLGDRLGFAADIVVVPLDGSRTRIVDANDARPQRAEMEADCAIHVVDIGRVILSDTIHGCLRGRYRGEHRAYSDSGGGGTAEQLSYGHGITSKKADEPISSIAPNARTLGMFRSASRL